MEGSPPHRVVWDRGYYKRTDVAERAGPTVLAVAVEGVDAGSVNTSGQWKTFIAICTLPVTKTETSFFRNSLRLTLSKREYSKSVFLNRQVVKDLKFFRKYKNDCFNDPNKYI
jgi:hypothetical protein